MEPGLDVVIPSRDRHDLVWHAVRSVLGQTHRDLVVWLVDAGSEPPLELPADVREDGRVQLVRARGPLTAGEARNLGVEHGCAPVVGFLDDDDRWLPMMAERQLELLRRLPERVAIVGCCSEIHHVFGPPTVDEPDPGVDLRLRLLQHPVFAPSATFVRRPALERVGGFPVYAPRTEDWALWLELAERYEAAVLGEVLVRRADSQHPPETLLAGYEAYHAHVRPRVEALLPSVRQRVVARQEFDRAVQIARAGRRREAAVALARAWRLNPRAGRPLLHLGRILTGERAWTALATYGRVVRGSPSR